MTELLAVILILGIIGLIIPFFIKIKNNEKYRFVFMSLLFGIILLLIDNASGGSLKRYSLEFAWLFVIPICLLVPKVKKKNILFIAIILSSILNFYVSLDTINDDYCLEQHNSFYYNFEYFFK